ncbi:Polysaccharide lyase [Penicillium bovifimosum]|uniref:Polysaccharide lyase n=1 Tax=Penicillium bovifimosum TaxID=126998 RepID=A0A9W9H6K0_9EURO|nr:Polysaccharide lyase [Penicillium bovifimosum]KAJ5139361.1 Polysaccharide lyase [Penicillium bovifimosum]
MLNKLPTLLALSLTAQAADFYNSGTTDGWDSMNKENKGTVDQVTNVVYKGPTALKMTQTYDSSYSGRYHSEVVKNDAYKRGDTGAYGFSFRLSEDWETSPAQSYNIAQFIADFGDTGCDDYMPGTMVWLEGDQLYSRVKQGSICEQKTESFDNLGSVSTGEWHRVEIEANWESDESGSFKLSLDGKNVLDKQGIATTIDDDRAFQFRVGLYANGWHDDGGMQGSQGTREIWYDEIAMGATLGDVQVQADNAA